MVMCILTCLPDSCFFLGCMKINCLFFESTTLTLGGYIYTPLSDYEGLIRMCGFSYGLANGEQSESSSMRNT